MNIQQLTPKFLHNNVWSNQNGLNNVSYPNLKPLEKDTLTFSGKIPAQHTSKAKKFAKAKVLEYWDSNAKNFGEIVKVADSYKKPLEKFLRTLKREMKPLIATDATSQNPVMSGNTGIKGRVKQPKSIAEKANARKLFTAEEIENLGDIGGARIIMRASSQQDMAKVFDILGNMVKKSCFKVKEIENYRPHPDKSYVSQSTLNRFEKLCQQYGQYPKITSTPIKSGYTAIHLSLEVPEGKIVELQIMGKDMERTKEIEDFYYKWRCGKGFDDKYKPIHDLFEKLMPKLDAFQKETLDKYIIDSYAHAIKVPVKSPKSRVNFAKDYFLPFPYSLPQELSYVNIHKMIEKCNKQAKAQ